MTNAAATPTYPVRRVVRIGGREVCYTIPSRALAEIWRAMAERIRPKPEVMPSDWCAQHMVLPVEVSPHRPGRFDPGWKPWLRPFMDLLSRERHKRGVICKKKAQGGMTIAALGTIYADADNRPGPILYIIPGRDFAAKFAAEKIRPVIKNSPRIKHIFGGQKDKRRTQQEMPFPGGQLTLAGAGTVSAVIGSTYKKVVVDEFDTCEDTFPDAKTGSLWTVVQGRGDALPDIFELWLFSHPRKRGGGIDKLYDEQSDRRAWCFDCPHCTHPIRPEWRLVKYRATRPDGRPDPRSAALYCPSCGAEVSDSQRRIATQNAETHAHAGGTGRFLTDLPEPEYKARKYIGLWVHAIADPDVSIAELAGRLAACESEEERMGVYTVTFGEAYSSDAEPITADLVGQRLARLEHIILPTGTRGCRLLIAGVDVQFPPEHPTMIVTAQAFTPAGTSFIVDFSVLTGWDALAEYLRTLRFDTEADGDRGSPMGPLACGIDCNFATGSTLSFARRTIINAATSQLVNIYPMRFQPYVKADVMARMASEDQRTDKTRPHLGTVPLWELHRHTWVNRTMRRWMEDRVTVLCKSPPNLAEHMTANVLSVVRDRHGWGKPRMEWDKPKQRRDDWAMAQVYAEAVAALEYGLDQLGEREQVPHGPSEESPSDGGGFLARGRRGRSWWNG